MDGWETDPKVDHVANKAFRQLVNVLFHQQSLPTQKMFWQLITFRCNLLPNTPKMHNHLVNSGVIAIGAKGKLTKRYSLVFNFS